MKSNPCCIVVNPRTPKFHQISMLSLGSALGTGGQKIKGPDNPTNQLLPVITSRCENEMGKAGRKGDGARQVG